ncbi:DDB1- and CUL4-associated factor 6 [Schistosoma japonicum]|uniref:DDB1-and CUL4-associated factor 6 n=2 Tax=Schistosoma japonicum TaxID=6182 RepID=A0A4Z2DIG0_SCHJA|nr:DDB1- and CUL4-associated factor 6 [Schistosoma japonicum]
MYPAHTNFEFTGSINREWVWKDNLYYFHSLKVKTELCYHNGCVNTICWDDHGEYILSGSDDRCIAIAPAFSQDALSQNVYTLKLPACSNIFTAKFLPFSCGSEIVVGFKCGCVIHVNPNSTIKDSLKNIFCHSFAVYDILTLQEMPTCFITLSHDHSATLLDTRATSVVREKQNCSRGCFSSTTSSWFSNFSVVNQLKFKFPVTAGDIHPLDGCRSIALATADGFVRLFDIRKLICAVPSSAAVGDSPQPMPFRVARPLGLPAKLNSNKTFRLDYGPGHITSVKFEPIYDNDHAQYLLPTGRRHQVSSSLGGKHLLVSHMYAPVFLYDLDSEETVVDSQVQRPDWLPNTDTSCLSSEMESPRSPENNLISDPNVRLTVALYRWLTQHRSRTDVSSSDETSTESQPESSSRSESGSRREPKLPIDYLTDTYISKIMKSSPRCREIMKYSGRECCSTVVKVSTFWGRNFILSGSECGHLIGWDRNTGKPALAIKADTSVVNRIIPHPHFPMIAVSGIDRSIKIIEPDPNIYDDSDIDDNDCGKSTFFKVVSQHEEEASHLCEANQIRTKQMLSSGNTHLDSIARLRASRVARMILLRLVEGTHEPPGLRDTDANT